MDGPFSCGQDLHGFYAQPNQKFEAANVGRHHVCEGGSECLSSVGKAVHRVARKPDAAGALGDIYTYIDIGTTGGMQQSLLRDCATLKQGYMVPDVEGKWRI